MDNKVAENPFKNRGLQPNNKKETSFIVVTALFVTLYVVSNVMAVKVIGLWNLFYFDAGTITFPFAYMLGDVLTEIWGYKTARKTIILAFLCNIFVVLCTQIGVWLPSPDYLDPIASAYDTVYTYVPRIVIASLTGFLLGELSNAWIMEKIKKKMKKKKYFVEVDPIPEGKSALVVYLCKECQEQFLEEFGDDMGYTVPVKVITVPKSKCDYSYADRNETIFRVEKRKPEYI